MGGLPNEGITPCAELECRMGRRPVPFFFRRQDQYTFMKVNHGNRQKLLETPCQRGRSNRRSRLAVDLLLLQGISAADFSWKSTFFKKMVPFACPLRLS